MLLIEYVTDAGTFTATKDAIRSSLRFINATGGLSSMLSTLFYIESVTDRQTKELTGFAAWGGVAGVLLSVMFAGVTALLDTLVHPAMRALASTYLADEFLMDAFRTCPAASKLHHAYLGGLLEHTVSVARAVSAWARPRVFCWAWGRVKAAGPPEPGRRGFWLVAPLPQWRQKKVKALVEKG